MGQALQSAFTEATFDVVGGSDRELPIRYREVQAEVIVDFSSPEANAELFKIVSDHSDLTILIGTTGIKAQQLAQWQKIATKHRLLFAPNTSLGVLALSQASKLLRRALPGFDVEIIETHHRHKVDQPSGTALFLAKTVAEAFQPAPLEICTDRTLKRQPQELGVHAVRGGSAFGEHTVSFFGESEELHLTHRAHDRKLFAMGAVAMTRWLIKQPLGMYQLEHIDLASLR
jgi:4-hydroxy-tetrahydrodipicolinate reductase